MARKIISRFGKIENILLVILPLSLLAANFPDHFLDQIRAGNKALDQNDLVSALHHYELAEEKTTDPGLVARNKGVVLYLEGRYREAELSFRCALENAPAERRGECLFGLGNCLLMESEGDHLEYLQAAIRCLDLCRRSSPLTETLKSQAEHNLELARLMAQKAENEQKNKHQPPSPPPNTTSKKSPNNQPKGKEKTGTGETKGKPTGPGEKTDSKEGIKERGSEDSLPGAGKLPTLKDDDQLPSLSEEDVQHLLQQAVERIREQRRQDWESRRSLGQSVKDW